MHWGQDSCNKSDGPGRILFLLLASMLAHIVSGCAFASAYTTYRGTPSNYRVLLKGLKPGDHLQLAPGDYKEGLPVHHLHGTPDARVTISGSNEKNRPIFLARPDYSTISILNSGYIVIRDLDIEGNFFYQNPHESLFQGEGNIALYNNVFVNHLGDAVRIQPHNDTPRSVSVFHNTVLAKGAGIRLIHRGLGSGYPQFVDSNIVFAESPINSAFTGSNLVGKFDEAPSYLARPFAPLGEMNLSPLPAALPKATRNAEDIPRFTVYPDADRDFDGSSYDMKRTGAYAPEKKRLGGSLY
jgi:hypothetical protein